MRQSWKAKDYSTTFEAAKIITKQLPDCDDAWRLAHLSALHLDDSDFVVENLHSLRGDPEVQARIVRYLAKQDDHVWQASELAKRLDVAGHAEAVSPPTRRHIIDRLMRLGLHAYRLDDAVTAGRLFRRCVELAPDSDEAKRYLTDGAAAEIRRARQTKLADDPHGYEAAWRRVLAYEPDHADGLRRVAKAVDQRGEAGESYEDWLNYLRADPHDEKAFTQFARAARRAGRAVEALRRMHTLGLDTSRAEAESLVREARRSARLAHKEGDPRAAATALSAMSAVGALAEQDATLVEATRRRLSRLLVASRREGGLDQTSALASLLLDLVPDDEVALLMLAQYAKLCRDRERAAAFYERLTQVVPSNASYRVTLDRVRGHAAA
ncbi:hypothetical protein [Labrys wisconsinensis]|uniref:Tetratricopeptide (TPR) repeat protein n=1 Tax=Labrys wisconsinensis TaxID=425677 RepID=A0ABU0JLR1_9HYPH|nr:hypothetical protein [Labrys wisconsinensis]MDQ0475237.1 tetratricopeptide (TPR) repeat protein [Labrys wisconsinensis]